MSVVGTFRVQVRELLFDFVDPVDISSATENPYSGHGFQSRKILELAYLSRYGQKVSCGKVEKLVRTWSKKIAAGSKKYCRHDEKISCGMVAKSLQNSHQMNRNLYDKQQAFNLKLEKTFFFI